MYPGVGPDMAAQFASMTVLASTALAPEAVLAEFESTTASADDYDVTRRDDTEDGVRTVGVRLEPHSTIRPTLDVEIRVDPALAGAIAVTVSRSSREPGDPLSAPAVVVDVLERPLARSAEMGWQIISTWYYRNATLPDLGVRLDNTGFDAELGPDLDSAAALLRQTVPTLGREFSDEQRDQTVMWIADAAAPLAQWGLVEFTDGTLIGSYDQAL